MSRLLSLRATAIFFAWLLMAALPVAAADTVRPNIGGWPKAWISKGLVDHPLVGRIYDVAAKKFVEPETYLAALPKALNVLLGEIHDNPDHHVLQALVVANLRPRAVVFEHFRSDQQTVIDAYQAGQKWMGAAGGDDQIERLFLVTGWENSGWPAKAMFKPLIEAVLASGAKIIAGNVPRRRIMGVAKNGRDALSEDARRGLWLDRPLGTRNGVDLDEALLSELEASHCGLMPKSAFGNMIVAQRFRDAHLAIAMTDMRTHAGDRPVVLLAGNGHVRQDRGVPWYIAQKYAAYRLKMPAFLTVAHVEAIAGKVAPTDYLEVINQYGFVVFTPRAKRTDPCEAMKKRFGKHKRN